MHYVFSEAESVWLGVANLVTKIMQETGALKAYSMCCQDTTNVFLKIAEDTIYRQLLMDISKFFDRPTIAGTTRSAISSKVSPSVWGRKGFTAAEISRHEDTS